MNTVNSVYTKLFKMKQYLGKAVRDKENAFTKSKYIDINGILELTEPALQEVGLLVVDEIREYLLSTKLIDPETGDFLESVASLVMLKQDPQSYMSSLSYMRRANRVALMGIAQTDDDGSIASGQSFIKPRQIKQITKMIMDLELEMDNILRRYGVSAIKDLYEGNAAELIVNLEKIKEAK